ncbi:hypothetical protein F4808DRAFT_466481 [Astrocystis sublimbata]|nr:hypothetical protein F4808DRAFT_466481 [Astrocystis sublimbata]
MATSSRLATSSVHITAPYWLPTSRSYTCRASTTPLPSLPPVAVPAPVAPPDITTRPAPTRSQPADGASTRNHNGFSPLVVQGLAGGDGSTRPRKRQRTAEEEPLPPPPSPEEVAATLGRCLEDQVFPHIERATAQLSPGIYDLDKLGARVIRQIVDKDFEHHFHQGNGRLSSSRELIIAAGVHRLVIELSARISPPYTECAPPLFDATAPAAIVATLAATSSITAGVVSAVPVPRIVLPSIENDVDEDDEDDGKDEEDDGSDDDHSDEEDGYDASDHGLDVGPDLDANLYIGVDDNDHEHPSLTKAAPQPRPRTPRLPRPPKHKRERRRRKS